MTDYDQTPSPASAEPLPRQEEYWRAPARFGSVPVDAEPKGWDSRLGFRRLYPRIDLPTQIVEEEWLNLTLQVWPIYPEDVTRAGGHPAPFPLALRLIKMYMFARSPETGFDGDLVLDMFNGTGATCVAAKAAGREFIGIDLNPEYCRIAEHRIASERVDPYAFLLEKPRVRKAKSSRQMPLFDEQPREPAPPETPAEYAIAQE